MDPRTGHFITDKNSRLFIPENLKLSPNTKGNKFSLRWASPSRLFHFEILSSEPKCHSGTSSEENRVIDNIFFFHTLPVEVKTTVLGGSALTAAIAALSAIFLVLAVAFV